MTPKQRTEAERLVKIPINKRWPGKYAFRVVCYLPSKERIEFETTLPEAKAKELLTLMVDAVTGKLNDARTP